MNPNGGPMTRSTRLTAASLAGLVALTACDRPATPPPEQAAAPTATPAAAHTFDAAINAADFGEMVKQLASDEFEGRGPGSPGEEKSVEYIKAQFERLGLKPGNNGSYF